MNKSKSIRLPEEVVKKIEKIAAAEKRSFNYIVNLLIEKGLED